MIRKQRKSLFRKEWQKKEKTLLRKLKEWKMNRKEKTDNEKQRNTEKKGEKERMKERIILRNYKKGKK